MCVSQVSASRGRPEDENSDACGLWREHSAEGPQVRRESRTGKDQVRDGFTLRRTPSICLIPQQHPATACGHGERELGFHAPIPDSHWTLLGGY